MNDTITNNLFEFWDFIGQKNNIYIESSNYKAVFVADSDWPKRVYAIKDKIESYEEIIQLSNKDLLPNTITLNKHTDLLNCNKIQLRFTQTNMSLDLNNYKNEITNNDSIHQVESKSDAFKFANIASESFGYKVDGTIVYNLCKDSFHSRLFIYKEKKESYGCGIVFFDKNNVAGFHMIGTIPKGRGKGIGKSITKKLIGEALVNNSKYCVLNASKMGEQIYKKLGFTGFGTLENYTILK
jgi:GNAT superfamily N-acetyltransferase